MYNNFLVCGDRVGNIFVYDLNLNHKDPVKVFKKLHGRLGVQSCQIIDSKVVTTGRDGTVRFYNLRNNKCGEATIDLLYSKIMPMNWVNRVIKYNNDYYVLGFKEVLQLNNV